MEYYLSQRSTELVSTLIPSPIAKLIGATEETKFILTLKQDGKNQLIYEQTVEYVEKKNLWKEKTDD